LPATLQLDNGEILAAHGTPTEDETFLLEDRVESRMLLSRPRGIKARLGDVKAALVLCGHSHTQQVVHIPGGPLIINPGSVGCPVFADVPDAAGANARSPHARYALLDRENGRWSVDMFALAYDGD
jgi:diadenosine tetraphosphatase ApaH/serine/threonine PP2A family protein phosphatase